jgi:hypothetical protein
LKITLPPFNSAWGFPLLIAMQDFSACFLQLLDKFSHFPVTNFSRQTNFFKACFELFSRKFGHLATVMPNRRLQIIFYLRNTVIVYDLRDTDHEKLVSNKQMALGLNYERLTCSDSPFKS